MYQLKDETPIYVTIEGTEVELQSMTRGFLVDSLRFYKKLCKSHNMNYEERKLRKKTRDLVQIELRRRHRTGHRMVFKPFID